MPDRTHQLGKGGIQSTVGAIADVLVASGWPAGSVTQDGLTFALAGVEPQAVPAKNEPAPDYRVSLRVSNTPPSDPTPRPS